jgi:hypothetical protein
MENPFLSVLPNKYNYSRRPIKSVNTNLKEHKNPIKNLKRKLGQRRSVSNK